MYSGLHSLPIDAKFQGTLDGTNLPSDACLVLTSDPKPRLRWTAELHERFVDAVTQLGGPEKIPVGKQSSKEMAENMKDVSSISQTPDSTSSPLALPRMIPQYVNDGYQVTEALRVQMEVQRKLHEQLEVQCRLQLRIEAQGKYLQSILEKACQALNDQTAALARLEAAKENLSELEIKVSTNYQGMGSQDTLKMPASLSELSAALESGSTVPNIPSRVGDCSVESYLTSPGSSISPIQKGSVTALMEKRPKSLFRNGDSMSVDPNMRREIEWMMTNIG